MSKNALEPEVSLDDLMSQRKSERRTEREQESKKDFTNRKRVRSTYESGRILPLHNLFFQTLKAELKRKGNPDEGNVSISQIAQKAHVSHSTSRNALLALEKFGYLKATIVDRKLGTNIVILKTDPTSHLTRMQSSILREIKNMLNGENEGYVTLAEIARVLHATLATIQYHVKRLNSYGYIQIIKDPHGRRFGTRIRIKKPGE
jgi:DNA-binding MarR family transcriptional regulator